MYHNLVYVPQAKPVEESSGFWRWTYHNNRQWRIWRERDHPAHRQRHQPRRRRLRPRLHPHRGENLGNERESPMTSPTMRTTRVDGGGLASGSNWQLLQKGLNAPRGGQPQGECPQMMRLHWQWSLGERIGRHLEVGLHNDGAAVVGLHHQIVDVEVVVPVNIFLL